MKKSLDSIWNSSVSIYRCDLSLDQIRNKIIEKSKLKIIWKFNIFLFNFLEKDRNGILIETTMCGCQYEVSIDNGSSTQTWKITVISKEI